jgi:hypothetical protein
MIILPHFTPPSLISQPDNKTPSYGKLLESISSLPRLLTVVLRDSVNLGGRNGLGNIDENMAAPESVRIWGSRALGTSGDGSMSYS